jgi:phosphoribosylformylglycinamidine (FGAM) synthase PurS component
VPRVVIDAVLKPEISDPQGQAVLGALGRLSHDGVRSVRQGKHFVLDVVRDELGVTCSVASPTRNERRILVLIDPGERGKLRGAAA